MFYRRWDNSVVLNCLPLATAFLRELGLLLYNNKYDILNFNEFGFDERLMEGIDAINYEIATPVQEKVIPLVLAGKDIIASAQTGTGKNGCFSSADHT